MTESVWQGNDYIDFILDGPPKSKPRYIGREHGTSFSALYSGYFDRGDGTWALRISLRMSAASIRAVRDRCARACDELAKNTRAEASDCAKAIRELDMDDMP